MLELQTTLRAGYGRWVPRNPPENQSSRFSYIRGQTDELLVESRGTVGDNCEHVGRKIPF